MSPRVDVSVREGSQVCEGQVDHYEAKLAFEIDSWDLRNAESDVVIIDARSATAFEGEHIPGAVSFPHRTMNEQTSLGLRRDCLYVTYCDGIGCNASTKGALNLARLGFHVKELIGGLEWWKRDGYPTEKGIPSSREPDVTKQPQHFPDIASTTS